MLGLAWIGLKLGLSGLLDWTCRRAGDHLIKGSNPTRRSSGFAYLQEESAVLMRLARMSLVLRSVTLTMSLQSSTVWAFVLMPVDFRWLISSSNCKKGRQIQNMRPYGCLFLMTPDMQELVALTQLKQVLPSQWAKIINSTYKCSIEQVLQFVRIMNNKHTLIELWVTT